MKAEIQYVVLYFREHRGLGLSGQKKGGHGSDV